MVNGIVLDVDDTLYLERQYVLSGFRAVGRWCEAELGVRGVDARAWDLFLHGSRGSTLTDALTEAGIHVSLELRERVVAVYREHEPDIRLLDDARAFLRTTKNQVHLGVITDGPAPSQEAKCRALGLQEWADPIVVTARMGTSKPDPAPFRRVEDAWGLAGSRLAYIADNPAKDFIAPLALGWRVVRLRRPHALHHDAATPSGIAEAPAFDSAVVASLLDG